MEVRPATAEEYDALTGILDAAALQTDPERIREAIGDDRALVAVAEDRVLGAAVCVPAAGEGVRIDAIAVRRRRRGQGIGSALVEAMGERYGRVVAEFGEKARPFYESLCFEIEPTDEPGRFRGVRE